MEAYLHSDDGMRAFIITPRVPGSAPLATVPETERCPDQALVQVIRVGVDSTDRELLTGRYAKRRSETTT